MKPRPDSGHPACFHHEVFHAEADAATATLVHVVGKITVMVEGVATQ